MRDINNINNINNITILKDGSSNKSLTHHTFREQVIAYFNERVRDKAIKSITSIRNTREEMLRARVKEHGRDGIFRMIDKACESAFLNGDNSRGFVATFDWLIRPNNFPKVLEGNYDEKNINQTDFNERKRRNDAASIMERLARENF